MNNAIKIIALDLEGTLISNAISQIARPHLHLFLEGCKDITERVVMYTTVSESRFRQIARLLVSEGVAPDWFASMEYVEWSSRKKNLAFICNSNVAKTVIVDDVEEYIEKNQRSRWVSIKQFASPYPDTDSQLLETLDVLRSYNTAGSQIPKNQG
ncbi:NIF family HAD-type phosphatase [Vibrio lentus]|uniref:NIF family HAD-type phosphatase n=1 Tax=Vibrio TaxID=662 RepID=UPI00037E6CF0|nr:MULTISPECIES: NIF family HAD-type phosphatase [Vibrio]OED68328.1 hypothetical protein A143_19545 [Vibrio splendidus ZS-139]MBU2907862.1 hypothetical protein [Vibrio splendidus]MCK8077639.1 hypothetical protein [Vibrio sp. 1CM2L]MDO6530198.1 NIF family HAD-type phosphatase [Vibrio splendidus]MDO6551253.1 NIF family HAD-type phosphatase [Vibrio splendidus]